MFLQNLEISYGVRALITCLPMKIFIRKKFQWRLCVKFAARPLRRSPMFCGNALSCVMFGRSLRGQHRSVVTKLNISSSRR